MIGTNRRPRKGRRSVSVGGSEEQRRRQRRPGRGQPLKALRIMKAKLGREIAAAAAAVAATVRTVRAAAVTLTRVAIMVVEVGSVEEA
jgi:hypothetical protein